MLEFLSLQPQAVFSEDLIEFTEEAVVTDVQRDVHEARVEEELDRWLADPSRLLITNSQPQTILSFWKRQQDNYRIMPIAAKVLFAIPSSAAQIERDFGITGMLVTSHRTSIAKSNIDMWSFSTGTADSSM
ncbi:hypothetical protein F443_10393 [Phytophthora nicotianae P1569]|uniref:HAT C-terminal dimerisation domain-containing protein n=1 Tax=Phytophthora nicotianae P1569 TaxID=1317065 RepID=V9F0C4_PHYNI|nr:hypothetical protein F443_10393 [Phytophthora nicotianae P1569]